MLSNKPPPLLLLRLVKSQLPDHVLALGTSCLHLGVTLLSRNDRYGARFSMRRICLGTFLR